LLFALDAVFVCVMEQFWVTPFAVFVSKQVAVPPPDWTITHVSGDEPEVRGEQE